MYYLNLITAEQLKKTEAIAAHKMREEIHNYLLYSPQGARHRGDYNQILLNVDYPHRIEAPEQIEFLDKIAVSKHNKEQFYKILLKEIEYRIDLSFQAFIQEYGNEEIYIDIPYFDSSYFQRIDKKPRIIDLRDRLKIIYLHIIRFKLYTTNQIGSDPFICNEYDKYFEEMNEERETLSDQYETLKASIWDRPQMENIEHGEHTTEDRNIYNILNQYKYEDGTQWAEIFDDYIYLRFCICDNGADDLRDELNEAYATIFLYDGLLVNYPAEDIIEYYAYNKYTKAEIDIEILKTIRREYLTADIDIQKFYKEYERDERLRRIIRSIYKCDNELATNKNINFMIDAITRGENFELVMETPYKQIEDRTKYPRRMFNYEEYQYLIERVENVNKYLSRGEALEIITPDEQLLAVDNFIFFNEMTERTFNNSEGRFIILYIADYMRNNEINSDDKYYILYILYYMLFDYSTEPKEQIAELNGATIHYIYDLLICFIYGFNQRAEELERAEKPREITTSTTTTPAKPKRGRPLGSKNKPKPTTTTTTTTTAKEWKPTAKDPKGKGKAPNQ